MNELRNNGMYQTYPTEQMIDEAGEQQINLWLMRLPSPRTPEEITLSKRIVDRKLFDLPFYLND